MDNKDIKKVWQFKSGSNPNKSYQTLQYLDGTISCDCPGWCMKKIGKERTCKHVRMVEMGVADQNAVSFKDRMPTQRVQEETPRIAEAPTQMTKVKNRKVVW